MGKSYIFECENGRNYLIPEKHCLSCKYCTDVFWDYTHGPYMCLCSIRDIPKDQGDCDKWEEDPNMRILKEKEDI